MFSHLNKVLGLCYESNHELKKYDITKANVILTFVLGCCMTIRLLK